MVDLQDISVVVSGPVYEGFTEKCLKSIRDKMPGAEIVLSTWKGENVKGLEYDILVANEEPGGMKFWSEDYKILLANNMNRQIVSTRNGLFRATRKYALKIRSDSVVKNINFVSYLKKYNLYCQSYRFVEDRIVAVCSSRVKFKKFFNINDWYFFGNREDLIRLWDIPLILEGNLQGERKEGYYSYKYNLNEHKYLMIAFLKKFIEIDFYNTENDVSNAELYMETLVNNFVLTGIERYGIDSLKYPYNGKFLQSVRNEYFEYQWIDWVRLYNKYCGGRERLRYSAAYLMRGLYRVMGVNYVEVLRVFLRRIFKD